MRELWSHHRRNCRAARRSRRSRAPSIAQLQDLASSHDVELVAIQPREGATIDTLRETVFDVELVGAYGDMVDYLRDVRRARSFSSCASCR